MPVTAIILLFLSASMHALWNFLLKSADEKYIAMGWQVILSGILAFGCILVTGLPPRSMWGWAVLSMFLEAVYFILLCIAYSDHDFSLVYPIARGGAPVLLVLWAAIFLREKLTSGGYLGLAMITGGMMVIGATTLIQGRGGEKPHLRGILTALAVAFIISVYTFVDGRAVKSGPVLPYGLSMFVMIPFVTTPYLTHHYGWSGFAKMWKTNRGYLLLGGVLGLVAYMLALYAYTFAPLSYSGAIREVSAVIGAFLGWKFLKEEMGGIRVVGSAIVFAGVMVIAIFG
ncbi:MAG: EamA family transporter [Chloroflexi bacterium]|nr:EamA family transporter [Chloroflexota bacterium]